MKSEQATSGATARPWTFDYDADHSFVVESKEENIGRVYMAENAALIVRAVNAHDALVAALERIVAAPDGINAYELQHVARAALELARKGG